MKLNDALNLPFEEYLAWCWGFVRDRMHADPVARAVLRLDGTERVFMEAAWAKRYWFHKNQGGKA